MNKEYIIHQRLDIFNKNEVICKFESELSRGDVILIEEKFFEVTSIIKEDRGIIANIIPSSIKIHRPLNNN